MDLFPDSLLLRAPEERFRICVVPAASSAAHAGIEFVGLAETDLVVVAVLRALIQARDVRPLRRHFPKKTDLSLFSQADSYEIALQLSTRWAGERGNSTISDVNPE